MKKIKFVFFTLMAAILLSPAVMAYDMIRPANEVIDTLVTEGLKENATIANLKKKDSQFLTSYYKLAKKHPDKQYISYKVISTLFKKNAANSAFRLFPIAKLKKRNLMLLLEDLFIHNNNRPYLTEAVGKIIKKLSNKDIEKFPASKILYGYEMYVFNAKCPKIQPGDPVPVLDSVDLIIKKLCKSDKYSFPYECLQQESSITYEASSSILKLWADTYRETYVYYPYDVRSPLVCDASLELPRRLTRYWTYNNQDKKVQEIITATKPSKKVKDVFWLK